MAATVNTSSGSYTIPGGQTQLTVGLAAPGGGGGQGYLGSLPTDAYISGGGGAGGDWIRETITVTPGETIVWTIGLPGVASIGSNGGTGGTTVLVWSGGTLTAHGGLGGTDATSTTSGNGGANTNFTGGTGVNAAPGTGDVNAGGGGAGGGGNGYDGFEGVPGGASPTSSFGGIGGDVTDLMGGPYCQGGPAGGAGEAPPTSYGSGGAGAEFSSPAAGVGGAFVYNTETEITLYASKLEVMTQGSASVKLYAVKTEVLLWNLSNLTTNAEPASYHISFTPAVFTLKAPTQAYPDIGSFPIGSAPIVGIPFPFAYLLDAAPIEYTVGVSSSTIMTGEILPVPLTPWSYVASVQDAKLSYARQFIAAPWSYGTNISSVDASTNSNRTVLLTPWSYTYTQESVSVEAGYHFAASSSSYETVLPAASIGFVYQLNAVPIGYHVTVSDVATQRAVHTMLAPTVYEVTESASIASQRSTALASMSYSWSPQVSVIQMGHHLPASVISYLTAASAVFNTDRKLSEIEYGTVLDAIFNRAVQMQMSPAEFTITRASGSIIVNELPVGIAPGAYTVQFSTAVIGKVLTPELTPFSLSVAASGTLGRAYNVILGPLSYETSGFNVSKEGDLSAFPSEYVVQGWAQFSLTVDGMPADNPPTNAPFAYLQRAFYVIKFDASFTLLPVGENPLQSISYEVYGNADIKLVSVQGETGLGGLTWSPSPHDLDVATWTAILTNTTSWVAAQTDILTETAPVTEELSCVSLQTDVLTDTVPAQ